MIPILKKLHQPRVRTAELARPESGQSLLEVALMLPFLLLLLVGIIEMGQYAYVGILLGNAAHAGAIYGSQTLAQSVDTNGITTAATNDFNDNAGDTKTLKLTSVNSVVTCGCDSAGTVTPDTTGYCNPPPAGSNATAGTCTAGHWVVTLSVTATGTFNPLFAFPGIPNSLTITRTSYLRVGDVG